MTIYVKKFSKSVRIHYAAALNMSVGSRENHYVMEKAQNGTGKRSLNMRSMFRFMMEEGYYPTYEKGQIIFSIDDNIATLDYQDGILGVRIFFTIEEDTYGIFLEAGNSTMADSVGVKPIVLDDRKTLMFSSETMCDNMREFKKFLPRSIRNIRNALAVHKDEMKLLLEKSMLYKDLYTNDNEYNAAKKFCS